MERILETDSDAQPPRSCGTPAANDATTSNHALTSYFLYRNDGEARRSGCDRRGYVVKLLRETEQLSRDSDRWTAPL